MQSFPEPGDPIFHIALKREWAAATTAYRPGGFDVDGFIHCSTASQVMKVARRLFRGRRDLVLLRIDPDLLESEVRLENFEGGDELFPHIYGELDLSAVTGLEPLTVGTDGEFVMPTLLVPARSATRGGWSH
ncbi:MAG TPA: DUF952 domain-containing protein [Vicinamibacterales bacterium]